MNIVWKQIFQWIYTCSWFFCARFSRVSLINAIKFHISNAHFTFNSTTVDYPLLFHSAIVPWIAEISWVSEDPPYTCSYLRWVGNGTGWTMVRHSASSRFAVFFLGLSGRRIAYSCIDLFRLFGPFLRRGRREDSLFAPSFSPGRAGERGGLGERR